jgi:hypothetical protein
MGLLGQALLVSWALLAYYLATHTQFAGDPAYLIAALLWLALTLGGLGRIAFALRAAPEARALTSGEARPSSDSAFTPTSEERHDHYFDCDTEERTDTARAAR